MIELEIRTLQSSSIQKQIDSLKELLVDTNIIITEEGMKINTMDESHTVLTVMNLRAENFQVFKCPKRYVIGVNLPNLNKIFKAMSNGDIITFRLDSTKKDKLTICLENAEKEQITEYDIDIMDIDEEEIDIPDQDYPYVINMPLQDFQKICRDMKNIGGKTIDIVHHKGELVFSTVGETITQRTTRKHGHVSGGQGGLVIERSPQNGTYQGRFSLEKLLEFCRGVGSQNVQIMLKTDMPLLFRYLVGSLGENTYCLAPMHIQ